MNNKNIFINCPYDDIYKGLLDAILFTVIALGFEPQLALMSSDSGENRIDKIVRLIKNSKYSIHDLSRLKATDKDEYFRLNMPFELGIDYGAKAFEKRMQNKKILILEKDLYKYRIAISDISGMDIKAHDNNGALIIECIRNWLVENANISNVPASDRIIDDYFEDFQIFLLWDC